MKKNSVLAMYDVHGIQKYIYRTSRVKDTMGASSIIENIVTILLDEAVEQAGCKEQSSLIWCDENGYIPYHDDDSRVKVLFVGGGNAYVLFDSRELCITVNQYMARDLLYKTYSLQLATAFVEVSGDYQEDYQRLRQEMEEVKAHMTDSKPYGALPIMKTELETGYPLTYTDGTGEISTETHLKHKEKLLLEESEESKKSNYLIEEKGVDSTLAVIHIDGNNMGLRIRKQLGEKTNYEDAVNCMRRLSYQINTSFKNVYEQMEKLFTEKCMELKRFRNKKEKQFIRKILVAGDDITYVCTGRIALATVQYFCQQISQKTLTGLNGRKEIEENGFSVCAGVAFVGNHYPFDAAYAVAESCCESAKMKAKQPCYTGSSQTVRIGNFVDFQICRNVQVKDLDGVRRNEYVTYMGEELLNRPYCILTGTEDSEFIRKIKKEETFDDFTKNVCYFQNPAHIPSSFVNEIRKTYSLGQFQMDILTSFLASRNIFMPDGTQEMYDKSREPIRARWYDATEMKDNFISLEEIMAGKENVE